MHGIHVPAEIPEASSDLESELGSAVLLETGHHRAAVFVARLSIERRLHELAAFVPGRVFPKKQKATVTAALLCQIGLLARNEARRVIDSYGRASGVVHGRPCNIEKATSIVGELQRVADFLEKRVAEIRIAGSLENTPLVGKRMSELQAAAC
jgi:hypothetical protein